MLFILAVEPDPAQVPHIESMTQKHGTELEIAGSSRAALCAMVERLPDMLLLSRALPLSDQRHLKAFIQGLGPAAAHVRVLPTPRQVVRPAPRPVPVPDTLRSERGRVHPLSVLSSVTPTPAAPERARPEPAHVRIIPCEQPA
jgi:hypothetical protein